MFVSTIIVLVIFVLFCFGAGGWFVYQKFFYGGVRSNIIIIRDDHVNSNSKSKNNIIQSRFNDLNNMTMVMQ